MPTSSLIEPAPLIGDRMPKVPALDGVRGLAIFAVFGYHLMPKVFPGGFLGVDMFFVLSAFLISSILMTEFRATAASGERGRIRFGRFYWHRFLRLAPALLVFLVVLGPLSAKRAAYGVHIYNSTVDALFYVMDLAASHVLIHTHAGETYDHLWSLAAEEQYYFVWPLTLLFLLRRLGHRDRTLVLVESVVVAAVVERISVIYIANPRTYFFLTGHLAPLAIGCLAAELAVFGMPTGLHRLVEQTWPAVIVFTAIAYSLVRWHWWALGDPYANRQYVAPTVAFAVVVAWLVLHSLAQPVGRLARMLSVSPLRWLGSRSYGFYIYHVPIWYLLKPPATGFRLSLWVLTPLVFVLSALFAEASFRWIERPIARAGRRWQDNRSRPQTDAEPYEARHSTR